MTIRIYDETSKDLVVEHKNLCAVEIFDGRVIASFEEKPSSSDFIVNLANVPDFWSIEISD